MFSCEFFEISKNNFCYRTPPVAASVCCRRKVAAVKIEKLKAFVIKYYDIFRLVLSKHNYLIYKNKQYKFCNLKLVKHNFRKS